MMPPSKRNRLPNFTARSREDIAPVSSNKQRLWSSGHSLQHRRFAMQYPPPPPHARHLGIRCSRGWAQRGARRIRRPYAVSLNTSGSRLLARLSRLPKRQDGASLPPSSELFHESRRTIARFLYHASQNFRLPCFYTRNRGFQLPPSLRYIGKGFHHPASKKYGRKGALQ